MIDRIHRCDECGARLEAACPECVEREAKSIILDLLACVPVTNLGPYLIAHARATKWLRKR